MASTAYPRRLAALFLGLLLALFLRTALPAGTPPRLVVLIVVDGLSQDQVVKFRDQYRPGGFKLLLQSGAWFVDAHQAHAATLTAPGHASISSGVYPSQHGIIANEWIDRKTLALVYCIEDPSHTYIGEETRKQDGTSPANLRVSTVGDELRYANGGKSKVIAISGKDRGAILLAGKTGTAYMYMEKSGRFASSTYYMKEHPQWHQRYYAARPQDRWFGKAWTLLLPESGYARSLPDRQPWFTSYRGFGTTFPFIPGRGKDRPDESYYATLILAPFGDEYTLDFARAAIEGEQLGKNPAGAPDLLGISLSTYDYLNHSFGPESRQSHDHMLHLDRALEGFFGYLRKRIGLDNVLIVLTADHGFMNAPQFSAARGHAAGSIDAGRMMSQLNEYLAGRFGAGPHALRFSYPTVILDNALIERKSLNRAEVESAAARFLEDYPGIALAITRTQLESGALSGGPLAKLIQRSWHRQLSGDIYVVQRPYWQFAGSAAATHGSPYTYDTNVPLMLLGKRWIKPGKYSTRVEVVDIAPTLAFLLETRPPVVTEGRVLREILPSGVAARP